MAPHNPGGKKVKATSTPSAAQRGIANMSSRPNHVDDDGDAQDRITSLPRNILGCILMLLSITEAAQMSTLSSTWRGVFSSVEYHVDILDDKDIWRGLRRPRNNRYVDPNLSWRCNAITSLLRARCSFIRRFFVQRTLLVDETVVSGWLHMLSEAGVIEDLVLAMPCVRNPVGLSCSIFDCRTLRSMTLGNCRWPARTNGGQGDDVVLASSTLLLLTELTLMSNMDMTAEDIKDLLRRCPALLSLSLGSIRQGEFLEIRCKNLVSFTKVGLWQQVVHIVDAPNLERLLWWLLAWLSITLGVIIAPGGAPKLQIVGIFKKCPVEVGVVWEQIRTVALLTNVESFEDVHHAFRTLCHFPQLETLHIKVDSFKCDSSESKAFSFEELAGGGQVSCLEHSLKTIVLRVNFLVRQKLAFANFLLGAAKSLRTMLIYKKRIAGELLPPERRGSSAAQVVFCDSNMCSLEMMDPSAANYKLVDPFMP